MPPKTGKINWKKIGVFATVIFGCIAVFWKVSDYVFASNDTAHQHILTTCTTMVESVKATANQNCKRLDVIEQIQTQLIDVVGRMDERGELTHEFVRAMAEKELSPAEVLEIETRTNGDDHSNSPCDSAWIDGAWVYYFGEDCDTLLDEFKADISAIPAERDTGQ